MGERPKLLQSGRSTLQYCWGDSSVGTEVGVARATLESMTLENLVKIIYLEFLVCENKKKLRKCLKID